MKKLAGLLDLDGRELGRAGCYCLCKFCMHRGMGGSLQDTILGMREMEAYGFHCLNFKVKSVYDKTKGWVLLLV